MDDKIFIEAVTERDIDLLLLEELIVSPSFRQWFVDRVYQENRSVVEFVGTWHSISDFQGESDIVYVDQDEEGRRAILVENKIDAPSQPEQAQRYRDQGDAGLENGDWNDFRTCLIAPQQYLSGVSNAVLYDAQISYEQIRNFFSDLPNEKIRMKYKAEMLDAAIEKKRRGYQTIPDPQVTAFYRDYWLYVKEHYPQLNMDNPGQKSRLADWVWLAKVKLPKGVELLHKLPNGNVDISLVGRKHRLDDIIQLNQDRFDEDILVEGRGKTAFIRISVPEIDRFRPFAEQQDKVDVALQAAVRLLELFPKIQLPGQENR